MVVVVFATTLLVNTRATAQGGPACSLSQTAGKWGFSTNGTVVGIGPRVSAGIFTLDAAGNVLDAKATSSLNGIVAGEAFSGTYSVNPDCTGNMDVDVFDLSGNKLFTATLALVFDQGAQEMRAIFSSIVAPNGAALASAIVADARKIREP
jgi:hypothetical protein